MWLLPPGWKVASMPNFPHTTHAEEGMKQRGRSRVETPWPGSVEIHAEEQTPCYLLADKPQSSCEPREIKED